MEPSKTTSSISRGTSRPPRVVAAQQQPYDDNEIEMRESTVPKLAHELRTRLAIIKGAIDNITDGIFGPVNQEQHKSLLIASEGVERMRELVEDLMASLAPGRAQMQINREIVGIGEIVRHSVESMRSLSYKEGIKLVTQIPKRLPMVYCDPVKIEQVLLNFLRNSIKFTSRGGVITVSVEDAGDHIVVGVSDTGVGIPAQKLDILFQPAPVNGMKTKDGGYRTSGLGLIIVKDILDAHGSTISVTSEIGKGSCFKFTLPTTK